MEALLKEADLRGMSRIEALFKYSQGLELDQEVSLKEVWRWRKDLEVEYIKKELSMPLGKWMQFIVKRRCR